MAVIQYDESALKRLIFALYVKGSAGKTFFQAHLLMALLKWGIRARGYDPDTSFHRLEAMCGAERVTRLAFEDPESLSVPVMDLAEGRYDVAVIDGVGSQLAKQKAYFKAVDFFSHAAELGVATTFVALIEDDTVIFEQVNRMMADVGARADWVFVKNPKLFNERFDPDGEQVFEFPIWDASEVRRRALEALPASEIALPKLSQKEAAYLVENNATALAAGRDHRLFVLQQAGFRTVWRRIEGQIRRARPSPECAERDFWPEAAEIDAFFFRPVVENEAARDANAAIQEAAGAAA